MEREAVHCLDTSAVQPGPAVGCCVGGHWPSQGATAPFELKYVRRDQRGNANGCFYQLPVTSTYPGYGHDRSWSGLSFFAENTDCAIVTAVCSRQPFFGRAASDKATSGHKQCQLAAPDAGCYLVLHAHSCHQLKTAD